MVLNLYSLYRQILFRNLLLVLYLKTNTRCLEYKDFPLSSKKNNLERNKYET